MGIDRNTGKGRRIAELDRQIEGRWALINRLFEDVEQLVDERDAILGERPGMLARLFARRQAPSACEAAFLALTEEHRHATASRGADDLVERPRLRA